MRPTGPGRPAREASKSMSLGSQRQSRIDTQREAVNLLRDFARRLAREFGVTDVSVKKQLAIINRMACDCIAAQRAVDQP
jgi:hypothetical protein